MKISVAAALLAQCVPAWSQTLVANTKDLLGSSSVDKKGQQPLLQRGLLPRRYHRPSTRLLHRLKNKASRHARKPVLLSEGQGVLTNSFFTHPLKARQQCDPASKDPDVGLLSCSKGLSCVLSDASDLGGYCEGTVSMHGMTQGQAYAVEKGRIPPLTYYTSVPFKKETQSQECDPNAPDLGILSCQEGEFCSRNENSDQGGFCVQGGASSRSLFTVDDIVVLCDPSNSDGYEKECDCSALNNSTGSGTITCIHRDRTPYVPGCEDVLFDETYIYTFVSGPMISFTDCYEITVPYYQKACFIFHYPIGASTADSCSLEVNGQECSSCAITDEFFDFDCSTIDPNMVGSTVYELSSILAQCYAGAENGTICTLCSEGYFIPEDKNDLNVTVPEYGAISCGTMAYAAASAKIPDSYCSSFATVAQNDCCEPSSTQGTNASTPTPSNPEVPEEGEPAPEQGDEASAAVPVVVSVRGVAWSVILSTLAQLFA
jgi:hypothetical protein